MARWRWGAALAVSAALVATNGVANGSALVRSGSGAFVAPPAAAGTSPSVVTYPGGTVTSVSPGAIAIDNPDGGALLEPDAGALWEVASVVGSSSSGSWVTPRVAASLNAPVVGVAPDLHPVPAGRGVRLDRAGQWMVMSDGGVLTTGDAEFLGSMGGQHLNAPVVGIASSLNLFGAEGYWLVAADGGVFSFGGANFYGSMAGHHLNAPIVGIAPTPDGKGYWLVSADGGVFAFGDAHFSGSMAAVPLSAPIVGIAANPHSSGYWLAGADGGVFAFGGAAFSGSRPVLAPGQQVLGIASSSLAGHYSLLVGSPLSADVQVLKPVPALVDQLAGIWAVWAHVPAGAVSTTNYIAREAYVPSTGTTWALVSFSPSPSASLTDTISFQDGAGTGIFALPRGGAWQLEGEQGEPPHVAPLPPPVLLAWHLPLNTSDY